MGGVKMKKSVRVLIYIFLIVCIALGIFLIVDQIQYRRALRDYDPNKYIPEGVWRKYWPPPPIPEDLNGTILEEKNQ